MEMHTETINHKPNKLQLQGHQHNQQVPLNNKIRLVKQSSGRDNGTNMKTMTEKTNNSKQCTLQWLTLHCGWIEKSGFWIGAWPCIALTCTDSNSCQKWMPAWQVQDMSNWWTALALKVSTTLIIAPLTTDIWLPQWCDLHNCSKPICTAFNMHSKFNSAHK